VARENFQPQNQQSKRNKFKQNSKMISPGETKLPWKMISNSSTNWKITANILLIYLQMEMSLHMI